MSRREVAEAFPPGEFIREEMEARNWRQVELAEILGRQPRVVNELILGKRSVTPETAKALGEAFGTSAQYWLNLESSYQLWRSKEVDNVISRRAKLYQIAPIKEMIRRNWIEASENIDVIEGRIRNFFGINSLDDEIPFNCVTRKGTDKVYPSHKAWFYRAQQLANAVHARKFSRKSFNEGLKQLRNLLHSEQEVRHVPKVLAEAGIRFIILEHLPQTKIDGVTFWLDAVSPVIALSLRYDRIDAFWFTLAHELGHIDKKDGLKNSPIELDIELVGDGSISSEKKTQREELANSFATQFLVNQSELDNFILRVKPLYGTQKILGFSNRIGVHPGIVVGQLQKRGEIPWSSHRKMLSKVRNVIIQSALTDGWGQGAPQIFRGEER